jgi:hypothetical protein
MRILSSDDSISWGVLAMILSPATRGMAVFVKTRRDLALTNEILSDKFCSYGLIMLEILLNIPVGFCFILSIATSK